MKELTLYQTTKFFIVENCLEKKMFLFLEVVKSQAFKARG